MKRIVIATLAAAVLTASLAASALAWRVCGRVTCEGEGSTLSGIVIEASSTDSAGFVHAAVTDANGAYCIVLPDKSGEYRLVPLLYSGETVVSPASGAYLFAASDSVTDFTRDWVIATTTCATKGACWFTGGGAKFQPICGIGVAECGKLHNFGGNVYPGCSPTAGDGGNWNHIAEALRLHFQGRVIQVVRCGNIEGIPPGSESPVTPFNFIEFTGTGTLKGIKGNKVDFGTIYFFAHCEDRNEPGSNGQHDGAFKDRYFLHVYSDPGNPAGSTLLLVDVDHNPATVDPVTITDGNFQIHISSCDDPPTFRASRGGDETPTQVQTEVPAIREFWFAAGPSPAGVSAVVRFGLPREANVSLRVFDVAGREMTSLANGRFPAGEHTASWDLRDGAGRRVDRGVYYLRMTVDGQSRSQSLSVN